jgi:hypothetical protein
VPPVVSASVTAPGAVIFPVALTAYKDAVIVECDMFPAEATNVIAPRLAIGPHSTLLLSVIFAADINTAWKSGDTIGLCTSITPAQEKFPDVNTLTRFTPDKLFAKVSVLVKVIPVLIKPLVEKSPTVVAPAEKDSAFVILTPGRPATLPRVKAPVQTNVPVIFIGSGKITPALGAAIDAHDTFTPAKLQTLRLDVVLIVSAPVVVEAPEETIKSQLVAPETQLLPVPIVMSYAHETVPAERFAPTC